MSKRQEKQKDSKVIEEAIYMLLQYIDENSSRKCKKRKEDYLPPTKSTILSFNP